jgi:hypothetical protein
MTLNINQVLAIDHKIYIDIKVNLGIYYNGVRTFEFNSHCRQYVLDNLWWRLKLTIWDNLIVNLK